MVVGNGSAEGHAVRLAVVFGKGLLTNSQIANTFQMHVISRKALRKAEEKHADLVGPLGTWFKVAKAAQWKNIEYVRKTSRDADPVGPYTVFNIKGNSYRLIVRIEYEFGLIFIREYDKRDWKQ